MAAKTCLSCLLSTGNASFLSFSSHALVFSPISPPFSSSEPQKIYAKILDGVLKYPPYLSEASKSIISKLCRLKSLSLSCVKATLFTVVKCLKVVMVSFGLQTAVRSEVRKHQKWNQRCATPQVTPAALPTELLVAPLSTFDVSSFLSSHLRWFSSINWHKLRMSQLDAPTIRLIRKASPKVAAARGFWNHLEVLRIRPFC